MGTTVFADGRGIATEDSCGQSIVFPDVCKTPSPGAPSPFHTQHRQVLGHVQRPQEGEGEWKDAHGEGSPAQADRG